METLKKEYYYSLNRGSLQAEGLFNVSNSATEHVSFWFDKEEKTRLLSLSPSEFIKECDRLITESDY
jgi:hypothetical protein